jgi:hypothetical protein
MLVFDMKLMRASYQTAAWTLYGLHLGLVGAGVIGLGATEEELFTVPILAGGLLLPISFGVSALQLRQSRHSPELAVAVPILQGRW